jgi:hypothetical protein
MAAKFCPRLYYRGHHRSYFEEYYCPYTQLTGTLPTCQSTKINMITTSLERERMLHVLLLKDNAFSTPTQPCYQPTIFLVVDGMVEAKAL